MSSWKSAMGFGETGAGVEPGAGVRPGAGVESGAEGEPEAWEPKEGGEKIELLALIYITEKISFSKYSRIYSFSPVSSSCKEYY